MHEHARSRSIADQPHGLLPRAARVAFTFVVLNVSAVAALIATMLRRKVWR